MLDYPSEFGVELPNIEKLVIGFDFFPLVGLSKHAPINRFAVI